MSKTNYKYDELPTPATIEEFVEIANNATAQRLIWLYGGFHEGWKIIHANNDHEHTNDGKYLFIEELKVLSSKIDIVKASSILENVDINDIIRFYYNCDLTEKQKVDPDIMRHDHLQTITDNIQIYHSQYKTPFGITNREFVAMRILTPLDNGGFLITIHSINRQDVPFNNNFVRGISNSGTLLIPKPDGKIQITTVDHIDPKGWIPSMIVNK